MQLLLHITVLLLLTICVCQTEKREGGLEKEGCALEKGGCENAPTDKSEESTDSPSDPHEPEVFQFPDYWNSETDHKYQSEKDKAFVEKFQSQLRRYIFDTEPNNDGVRTVELWHSLWCEAYCGEKDDWTRHRSAFREAKRQVIKELTMKGFSVREVDSITTTWSTAYGDHLIIERIKYF